MGKSLIKSISISISSNGKPLINNRLPKVKATPIKDMLIAAYKINFDFKILIKIFKVITD